MIDRERFRRVVSLFERAAALAPGDRESFLSSECGADQDLADRVRAMIEADAQDDDLLDGSAIDRPSADPCVGTLVGPYRLEERIGAGGMGVVYRARRADGAFEQEVAVKRVRDATADESVTRRFEFERRVLAALSHPNIARLLDAGADAFGRPCVIMEFVDGEPIDRHCDARRLDLAARLRLFATVCRAVHHAHQKLVLHRDLKPGNILIDRSGAPKLLDFGIARLLHDDARLPAEELTETRVRHLTPEYASPEQFRGDVLTIASDVYSLGVVLYRILTGVSPYDVAERPGMSTERAVLEHEPRRPSTVAANEENPTGATERATQRGTTPRRLSSRLAGDLDQIVLKALRKDPTRRYSSCETFANDIDRYLAGMPVSARPDGVLYRLSRLAGRHRVAVASVAIAVVAMIGATGVSIYMAQVANAERDAARVAETAAEREAVHARIEWQSANEVKDFLLGSFLASGELSDPQRRRAIAAISSEAEAVRRRYTGQPHLRANLLDALGVACLALDEPEAAGRLIGEALRERREAFGDESLEVALSLASLGELQLKSGDVSSAAVTFAEALRLHEECPVGAHTDVASAANNLAVAWRNLRRLDDAAALHERALAIRRDGGHDAGLAVAESLNNLAAVRLDQQRLDDATALAREALDARRRVLGDRHPLTLQAILNLSTVAYRKGEVGLAEELLREVVDGYRDLADAGREGLTMALQNLATLLIRGGAFHEAGQCLDEALVLARSALGDQHPRIAALQERRAIVAQKEGDVDGAREMFEGVVALRRATLPPRHIQLGRTLQTYGVFLVEIGRFRDALEVLDESAEIYAEQAVDGDPDVARVQVGRGLAHAALGELEQARQELRDATSRLEELLGPDALDTRTARHHLEKLEGARTDSE